MPREYHARARADSVARTRARILKATRRLLPTGEDIPVDRIAATAGVSVQTLYTHFGSKRGLLLAVIDEVQRDVGLYVGFEAVWQSPDGETALRRMLEATFKLWHGAWPFVEFSERARRTDPEMGRVFREIDGYRLGNLRSITDQLALEGRLRADIDSAAAGDLAFALSTPSTYGELVRVRGWSLEETTAIVSRSIIAGLIDAAAPATAGPPADWSSALRPSAAIGLSSSGRAPGD